MDLYCMEFISRLVFFTARFFTVSHSWLFPLLEKRTLLVVLMYVNLSSVCIGHQPSEKRQENEHRGLFGLYLESRLVRHAKL